MSYPEPTARMPNPAPYSEQAFIFAKTLGVDFQLNELTTLFDARAQQEVAQPFRAINCAVDITMPVSDSAIVILGHNGENFTYYAMNSGPHVILGYKIISIGAAIDPIMQVLF